MSNQKNQQEQVEIGIDIETILSIKLECLKLACQINLMGDGKNTLDVAKEFYYFIANED